MPFINDQLTNNAETNQRNKQTSNASRKSRFIFTPESVVEDLEKSIIGQDHVIAAMSDLLYVLKADIADPSRPLSVNLFLGPTGVGKTETARALAKSLLGSSNALCRIDMNTLAQEHYSAAITGAPPGYTGSKEGHTLFDIEAIEGSYSKPGMVLFDEIEKASPEVVRSLLNILDTGKLKLTSGTKTINFCNTLIFMTSNLGAKELATYQRSTKQRLQSGDRPIKRLHKLKPRKHRVSPSPSDIVKSAVEKAFDPEFINRIERQLTFNALSSDMTEEIVKLEMEKLNHRLATKNISVSLDPSSINALASHYDQQYGARNITQLIRTCIYPIIARAMHNCDDSAFSICFNQGEFQIVI